MKCYIPLSELVATVLQSMEAVQFSPGSIKNYEKIFSRLKKLADSKSELFYTPELGRAFIEDSQYARSEEYCYTRYCLHNRCIQFIESYIQNGSVDWSPKRKSPEYTLKSNDFSNAKVSFENLMLSKGLKKNTIEGYRRLVHYFLRYLESKGYNNLAQIRNGDVIEFIELICREHYQSTSLGAHLPGLKMFLEAFETTSKFSIELPVHLPKKVDILEIYTDEEHDRIIHYLENSNISLRNKSICLLSLETGMRAVDICNLKLKDIDWQHDCIHHVQAKTGRLLNIPLLASYGNAIADYLVSERPTTDSEYVFLRGMAPFNPLSTHSGCRNILFHAVTNAGIEANNRIYGTRITRHSIASRMLRKGVPLPVISEILGHGNPNSVMIYLSTENAKLVECTLPLPGKENLYAKQ